VCWSCAKRIARLVAEREPETLAEIWSSTAPPRPLQPAPSNASDIDAERVFEKFKQGLAEHITPTDAASHFHISEAYREMGLYVDAVREAGVAVGTATVPDSVQGPLRLLLTPPLLMPDGLERLRRLLKPRAS
jgi:hypothetical protein